MCLIAYCRSRAMTRSEIMCAWSSNPHGAGIAYVSGGRVIFKKGIEEMDTLIDEYKKISDIFPHVVHFRIPTTSPDISLTHPFIVSMTSPLVMEGSTRRPVLFHNGVIASWKTILLGLYGYIPPKKASMWSDSRIAAVLASKLGPGVLSVLGGKYVYFSPDKVYVYGNFYEDNGIMYSNNTYKRISSHTSNYKLPGIGDYEQPYGSKYYDEDDEELFTHL